MEKSLFEQMGGTYTQQGNYILPNLILSAENQPIGIWRQRHGRYLKQHHRILYYNLLTSGKLSSDLTDIDKQAEEMFSRIINEMIKKQGISEPLKANDQMAWVGKMNNIINRAIEIVNYQIIILVLFH